MTTNKPNIEHLINRKLSGEISAFETTQLFNWVNESEENAILYKNTIKTLGYIYKENKKNSIWENIESKATIGTKENSSANKFLLGRIWRVAAILVLIALIPMVLGKYGENEIGQGFVHTVKGNDVTTTFFLPDGSMVILSRGSEISFNKGYSENNRELNLKGKAYIEINNSTSQLPVVINSGKHCAIARHGKLSIDGNLDQMDVAIEEGEATVVDTVYKKVIIPMFKLVPAKKIGEQNISNELLENSKVTKGQRITFSGSGDTAKTEAWNHCEVFSWKDRVFCFSNLKQHEMAFKIAEWYGKRVEFKGDLDPFKNYSGSYDNPTIQELVKQVFGQEVKEVKETKKKITVIFS